MTTRRGAARASPDAIAVVLLGATFLGVALLLGQALTTLRSNARMVDVTMEDFAGFAAERIAAELNSTFSSIFLDQIAVARAAHYSWLAGQLDSGLLPSGRYSVPQQAIPVHFSIVDGRLVTRGGAIDHATESWVLEEVGRHVEYVYPRPAPYALLRSLGPAGARALAYRKEEASDGSTVYGFLIDFSAFRSVYERLLGEAQTLPMSLASRVEPEDVMSVDLVFPQGDEVLFSTRDEGDGDVVRAEAFAAKAGRMAVRVELDATRTAGLIGGGYPRARLSLIVALALLTFGLLGVAVVLLRRASRLTRLRERFVANVSHDLRTPLAQIRMFSETLLLGRLSEPRERRRSLEIIRRQATDLSDLVDNILHASAGGYPALRPERTRLDGVLAEVRDALAPSLAERSVELRGDTKGAAEAWVDPAALRRILVNLVDNALKYGPRGQTVTVGLDNRGDTLVVMVDDQGPGVPRRERARVWERFRRLDTDDRSVTGTGLGLAVVRDLAERHGGDVRLASAPGGGASVRVRIATGRTETAPRPSGVAAAEPLAAGSSGSAAP